MPVDIATVATVVQNMLNSIGDPRWTFQGVLEAIQAADAAVCAAVVGNSQNPRAKEFYIYELVGISGSTIGFSSGVISGPVVSVQFQASYFIDPQTRIYPAIPWDSNDIVYEEINFEATNFAFNNTTIRYLVDPRYRLDGAMLYHNALAFADGLFSMGLGAVFVGAWAIYPRFAITSACQAPAEYTYLVIAGAMSILVPVEGENASPHSTWAQMFQAGLQAIRTAEGNLPGELQQRLQQGIGAAA